MKKVIYLFILILFFTFQSVSQVDNIKQKSKSFKSGNDYGNSNSYDGIAGLLFFLFNDVAINSIDMLIVHHQYLIENKENYPIAFSADYMPHLAFNQNNQYNMLQRIRGTLGVFSTDFRLNYLTEISDLSAKSYSTLDWQIIQFSTYPSNNVNIRFGTGLLYDNYSDLSFNEHSLGLELYFKDYEYWFALDGRFALDYERGESVYKELNFRCNYRIIKTQHFNTYFTIGALYQNYYSVTDLFSAQGGLSINLH